MSLFQMKSSKYLRKLANYKKVINSIKNNGKMGKKKNEKKSLMRVI